MLFVGRDTAGSGVHTAFPVWARALGLGNVVLRGVDVHADADRQVWRDLVVAMRDNPRVRGAVVTDHKLRLYRACADLVDVQEPTVGLMAEINSLRVDDGRVFAFARDVLALHTVLGHAPLPAAPPAVVCLGAGGAATALLLATALDVPTTTASGEPTPAVAAPALTFVDRDPEALDALRQVLGRLPVEAAGVRLLTAPTPQACAEVVAAAPAGTLVVNATGLGKVGPESPLPDGAAFPPAAVAWDFNYRGPLTFLAQARAAGVAAVDGRDYFLAGWACALGGVFDLDPARALTAIRGTEPAAA